MNKSLFCRVGDVQCKQFHFFCSDFCLLRIIWNNSFFPFTPSPLPRIPPGSGSGSWNFLGVFFTFQMILNNGCLKSEQKKWNCLHCTSPTLQNNDLFIYFLTFLPGSGQGKNMRILRIRIRNPATCISQIVPSNETHWPYISPVDPITNAVVCHADHMLQAGNHAAVLISPYIVLPKYEYQSKRISQVPGYWENKNFFEI